MQAWGRLDPSKHSTLMIKLEWCPLIALPPCGYPQPQSGMAVTAMPYMATYAASKSFMVRWTEGLAAELRGTNIRAIAVCPGTFHSNFAENAGIKVTDIPGAALVTYSIEAVAEATLKSIHDSHPVVIPGFVNRFAAIANAFVPKRLLSWALSILMARAYRRLSD